MFSPPYAVANQIQEELPLWLGKYKKNVLVCQRFIVAPKISGMSQKNDRKPAGTLKMIC
jgi:hypothetical protein